MNLYEAVHIISEHSRSTGLPARDSVRLYYEELDLSPEDVRQLVCEALFSKVSQILTTPRMADRLTQILVRDERPVARARTHMSVTPVQVLDTPRTTIKVRVTILDRAVYQVNGKSAAIIDLLLYDVLTLARASQASRTGHEGYENFFLGLAARMRKLNKKRVSDLAEGEIDRFVREFEALKKKGLRVPSAPEPQLTEG